MDKKSVKLSREMLRCMKIIAENIYSLDTSGVVRKNLIVERLRSTGKVTISALFSRGLVYGEIVTHAHANTGVNSIFHLLSLTDLGRKVAQEYGLIPVEVVENKESKHTNLNNIQVGQVYKNNPQTPESQKYLFRVISFDAIQVQVEQISPVESREPYWSWYGFNRDIEKGIITLVEPESETNRECSECGIVLPLTEWPKGTSCPICYPIEDTGIETDSEYTISYEQPKPPTTLDISDELAEKLQSEGLRRATYAESGWYYQSSVGSIWVTTLTPDDTKAFQSPSDVRPVETAVEAPQIEPQFKVGDCFARLRGNVVLRVYVITAIHTSGEIILSSNFGEISEYNLSDGLRTIFWRKATTEESKEALKEKLSDLGKQLDKLTALRNELQFVDHVLHIESLKEGK